MELEATGKEEGLLNKIRPPRLEDAGLEDCALPQESIKEAFQKAASAVRSIISYSSDDDVGEGHCVNDPWPTFGDSSDTIVGIEEGVVGDEGVRGGCAVEKGGGSGVPDVAGDEVAVKDAEEKVDEILIGGPAAVTDDGKACVDGLQGLEIGGKGDGLKGKKLRDGENVDNGDDEEEDDGETPIFVEGYV